MFSSLVRIYYLCIYLVRVRRMMPKRYANLLQIIYKNKAQRILEIGTYNGVHASEMIEVSKVFYPAQTIEYFGFDIFEPLTEEKFKQEFSKQPPALREVQAKLNETKVNIHLYKGDTRSTLSQTKKRLGQIDCVFIDGGHSNETIRSDWNNVKDLMGEKTVVIFDDYYTNTEAEIEGVGCQNLIDSLNVKDYEVQILEPMDSFIKEWGVLKINMVKVIKK